MPIRGCGFSGLILRKNQPLQKFSQSKGFVKIWNYWKWDKYFFFFFFFLTSFSSFRLLELYQTGLELARKIFSKEQIFLKTSKKNLRRLNLGDLASAFFILVIEISMSFAAFLG
jgi:hypothetical protein